MTTHELVSHIYEAFNNRDVDSVFALMSDNVSWPKASEGGRVVGKHEIRQYWMRQWAEFDPHVEIINIQDQADGTVKVSVHQIVKNLKGDLLADLELSHVYQIQDNLIERMDILDSDGSTDARSSAFQSAQS